MNTLGTIGGLVPLWIIGAPLLAGIFALFTTPKPSRRHDRDDRNDRYDAQPAAPLSGRTVGTPPARM